MCFSATASFVTAAVTSVIGVVSLNRVTDRREMPLAATPLLFAFQQCIEGLLWLQLPLSPDGMAASGLTFLFLFFADVLWPVYCSVAVLLIEPDPRRRRLILVCLAIGAGVSAQMLWSIVTRPYGAVLLEDHIVYLAGYTPSVALGLAYLAATGLPLMLSSHRTVVVLGSIILIGSATAFFFYWEGFTSVWCFFAAAASVVILGHFEQSRRLRLGLARA